MLAAMVEGGGEGESEGADGGAGEAEGDAWHALGVALLGMERWGAARGDELHIDPRREVPLRQASQPHLSAKHGIPPGAPDLEGKSRSLCLYGRYVQLCNAGALDALAAKKYSESLELLKKAEALTEPDQVTRGSGGGEASAQVGRVKKAWRIAGCRSRIS